MNKETLLLASYRATLKNEPIDWEYAGRVAEVFKILNGGEGIDG